MIRLYNHTGVPDKPIKDILTWAYRKIGVRGDIPVKVSRSDWHIKGTAYPYWPYLDYMRSKPGRKRTKNRRMPTSPKGFYVLSLPTGKNLMVERAIRFVEVALHETAHIWQYRNGMPQNNGPRSASGRKPAWEKRPSEIDAENRVYEVLRIPANKRRADDLALALALALEAA